MRRKDKGYVLLVVLVFLQLFALLSLESLAGVVVERKQQRLSLQRVLQQTKALQILQWIDNEGVSRCISEKYAADKLTHQSLAWWSQHACHGKVDHQDYYYLRETFTTAAGMYYRHSLRIGTIVVQDTIDQEGVRLMLRWLR